MTSRRLAAAAAAVLTAATVFALVPQPAVAEPVNPTAATRGSWSVQSVGGGRYQVSWRSPGRLPNTSDRPTIVAPAGMSVATSTVATDRRTVRAVIRSTTGAPDPTRLDVQLSGDRLDHAGRDRVATGSAATSRTAAASDFPALATDPGTRGPYAVVSSDYTRPSVKIPGMPQPIEMVGHVVEPAPGAATGPRPLVLFLHGRHEYCYQATAGQPNDTWPCRGTMREIPSHLGYDYSQRQLASQGYTTVSVRVNGINAQDFALDDGGAGARATIVQRHLSYWATIAAAHQVDLARTILVGHSRGGEGVDRASIRVPLSAPYRIVGQVLIAPTNFGDQTAPYVPTVTLLPYCDGDVFDLQGQRFTDISRDIDRADPSLKSSVMVMGANHNFFNTEWTPGLSVAPSNDDWFGEPDAPCGTQTPDRLTAAEQRKVGRTYIAGAVHLFAGGEQAVLPMFDGSRVSVPSAGPAMVLSHAIGGGRDVRRPSRDTALALPNGARTEFCVGAVDFVFRPGYCAAPADELVSPHWQYRASPVPTRRWFSMTWSAAGQAGGVLLNSPLDLRSKTLDLRTVVDPRLGAVRLKVRLTDAGGASATLTPLGGTTVRPLPEVPGATKIWAQNVRVDPSGSGLDLARITRVDLVGDSADGRVWVADLAAAGDRLAAVPDVRLPALSVGVARVAEGDRPGTTTAEVPFRLSAPLTTPGQILAYTSSAETRGAQRRFTIDLAPGQTSGTIPVGYEADTRDDVDETITLAATWATRGLMTDDYLGQLVVVDDDPTPALSVKPVASSVAEGAKAQWRLKLAAPVDYPVEAFGTVARGPNPRVTGFDVPKSWFEDHAVSKARSKPLDVANTYVTGRIRPGETTAVLSIPTRKDGRKEGKESVTLSIQVRGKTIKQTIYVKASG